MTYINLDAIFANNTLNGILYHINQDIGRGWFFTLILIAFFIVLMVSFGNYSFGDQFFAASFFAALLAGFFWLLGWISILIFVAAVLMATMAALMAFFQR